MSDIQETIADRRRTHGDFADVAATYADLVQIARPSIEHMGPVHRMSLEMIFHKIARIVNGDPNFKDHWHDIAGYAALAERGNTQAEKK